MMVKEFLNIVIKTFMMDNGNIANVMVMVKFNMQMVVNMKERGKMIKKKEKEDMTGLKMETIFSMMENGLIMRDMAKVNKL